MNEIDFCEKWCDDFNEVQKKLTEHYVNKGCFLGVGTANTRSRWWPLIVSDSGKVVDVIDTAGYRQNASLTGRREFNKRGE